VTKKYKEIFILSLKSGQIDMRNSPKSGSGEGGESGNSMLNLRPDRQH